MSKEEFRSGERGGAGGKLLLVLTILILIGHAGINYIPVAYAGESLKQDIQTAVIQGLATPQRVGTPQQFVKEKIQRAIAANDAPPDTYVEVKQNGKNIQARVYYTKVVNILPFGIYKYNYVFDQTVTPTGFLMKGE
jgi:hypothetical protein